MKEYSLLIWEEIPENSTLYLIPNDEIGEVLEKALTTANGNYLNGGEITQEESDALNFINNAITPEEHKEDDSYFPEDYPMENRCFLAKFKKEIVRGEPLQVRGFGITTVYHAGFIM